MIFNNIEVEKPTIQNSENTYIVKNNKIVFPISNIKGVGSIVSEQITKAKEQGPFQDIYDCISRLYIEGIGKKTLEDLIMADLFKDFNYNRATLIYNLDSLFNYAELTKDIDPSLVMKPDIEIQKEFDNQYLLEKEKEVFGFYLSSHPTSMYQKDNPNCVPLNKINEYYDKTIDVLLLVEKVKTIVTKKGDNMSFITGSDETSSQEFTLFPKQFLQAPNIKKGDILKIRGHVEKRYNEYQIIIEKVRKLKGEKDES